MIMNVGDGLHRLLRPDRTAFTRCLDDLGARPGAAGTPVRQWPDAVPADLGAWDPYRSDNGRGGG
jgi:hypothetical protein